MKDTLLLESDLQKLIDCQTLEVYRIKDNIYIPYMMNDAVECYYEFVNATTMGEWDNDYQEDSSFSLTTNEGRQGLILRQGESIFSIWYEDFNRVVECYQYHRIGHFWIKGMEHIRRIVYAVGTIHEKQCFIGDEVCNDIERDLIPLVEFGPYRYWTPLEENLDDYYIESYQGIEAIRKVAKAVDDTKYLKLIDKYEKAFSKGKVTSSLIRKLAIEFTKPKHFAMYEYINKQIDKASSKYQQRKYKEKEINILNSKRQEIFNHYLEEGYSGNYPLLSKDGELLYFYEEHPYIMRKFEYKDFGFRVHAIKFDKKRNYLGRYEIIE